MRKIVVSVFFGNLVNYSNYNRLYARGILSRKRFDITMSTSSYYDLIEKLKNKYKNEEINKYNNEFLYKIGQEVLVISGYIDDEYYFVSNGLLAELLKNGQFGNEIDKLLKY